MRFLIDMPVSPRVAAWLVEQGHDAVHAMAVGLGRASDREVLDRALQDNRLVVTADTDFPQLLTLAQAKAPGVILFRGGNYYYSVRLYHPADGGKRVGRRQCKRRSRWQAAVGASPGPGEG
jgi:predicted nuclease of predicted toxin-antitoxin system